MAYLLTRKVRVELPGELVEEIEKRFKQPVEDVVKEFVEAQLSTSFRPSRTQ